VGIIKPKKKRVLALNLLLKNAVNQLFTSFASPPHRGLIASLPVFENSTRLEGEINLSRISH
jgi:hypothetical protein